MDLQDNLALGDAWLHERFCGQPDERFIQIKDTKRMEDFLRVVHSKRVTLKDAKRMEVVLNSCCSEQNLHELMGVLNGDVSFNPALVEVARKISRHYTSKMDFQDNLALGRALADERLFGQPEERLMKKCKEDLKVIETASGGTLILFIERLVTEKEESDWLADFAGSLSGTKPSKAMIEGMAIQTCRRQDQ